MSANSAPIFSREGALGRGMILKTAANDYNGISPYNRVCFTADSVNGSFVQRIRFKPLGTNVATVVRLYLNDGAPNETFAAAPTAPTGTPSGSGGTIVAGSYYGLVVAENAQGMQSVLGAQSSVVTTTGSTSSISWSWTAVVGATNYRLYVGNIAAQGAQAYYFDSVTNSFSQTAMYWTGTRDDPNVGVNKFYGELSLPATTISATAALVDIDYPMNFVLPASFRLLVGLGTTVAAGWSVITIGGNY